MKKWFPWVALGVAALLLAAVIFGAVRFIKLMNGAKQTQTTGTQSVEAYFESAWDGFTLVSYDSDTRSVELQKQFEITYEQACSFGKECYEEVALGHTDTMKIMQSGCEAACGVILRTITVNGCASDGQVIYTVKSDGSLTACWE